MVVLAITVATLALSNSATPARAANETVNVWLTTADLSSHLSQQANVTLTPDASVSPFTINVDESKTYQSMFGFGATFTDSSAWLVYNKLSSGARLSLMQDLFDASRSNGIGLNLLRQPMGATDFIVTPGGYFTYDDIPVGSTDFGLTSFSIAHDTPYVIPVLQQAVSINPDAKVMLTGWTAPAWMKDNGSLIGGGSLKSGSSYSQTWANYLVKGIQAYQGAGIPIWATSGGNEPSVGAMPPGTANYPTMTWTSANSAAFIRDYYAPRGANQVPETTTSAMPS